MFTGIIESCASIQEIVEDAGGRALALKVPFKAVLGESIAVDGACVTVSGLLKEGFKCWFRFGDVFQFYACLFYGDVGFGSMPDSNNWKFDITMPRIACA